MKAAVVEHLRAPGSAAPLVIERILAEEDGEIREGSLLAEETGERYRISNFIPRFVEDDSYTASFGEQWNRYRRTQLDRFNGTTLSHERFFSGTGWTKEEMRGQRILEVGGGAGRFTEVMIETGAEIYSIDYSSAVDASWANNGPHPRLFIAQADLYRMPFQKAFFDKVFCYGVVQHTPDVKRTVMSLIPFLKPGGKIAIDIYLKLPWIHRWTAKNWYRPLTKRMPRTMLRKFVEWYVPRWIPIDNLCQRLPVLRTVVPAIIPCWNYTGMLPLTADQIEKWAILDTFDALSPRYDSPQTIETAREWFEEAGLLEIDVRAGGNGILAGGVRPGTE
ncbi:MAG: methyltransferase domain-containing protein [Acidobacteria bacterium]|nr:methyltransferase domain-containing protein [Acidobacteriota bacterium]